MDRDKKVASAPTSVALRTSFGMSSLDASSSTLFGSSTDRKRGRAELSSSPEPASSPPPPPKQRSSDHQDYLPIYPEYEPGFWSSWPKQETEGKRTKGEEKRQRRFIPVNIVPIPHLVREFDLTWSLRRFRTHLPQPFIDVYERAVTQRFYVLSRRGRGGIDFWFCPEEEFEIAGSTGNVYNVTIAQQPTCTCPHAEQGKQCKHVVFVLARVLRAKPQYIYQLALLSEELVDTLDHAPPSLEQLEAGQESGYREKIEMDKKRKPVEGD